VAGGVRPISLRCDNCGAALRPAAHLPAVECDHCHHVALLRPPAPALPARARSRAGVVGGAVLAVCGIAAVALAARGGKPAPAVTSTTTTVASSSTSTATSTSVSIHVDPGPAAPPRPWREVLQFGQAGTAGGQFTDPRHIAVSADGKIHVAEARTGRVHRFDGAGRFEALHTLPPSRLTRDVAIFGLAAAPGGRIWVNRGGDLLAVAPDGRVERTVAGDYPETWFHGAVGVDATGAVVAVTDRTGRHDAVRVSAAGKILGRIANTGARELAVDGLGSVVLARRDGIDLLAPDGALRARFGQIASPGAVAIDPRGRIFVDDGGRLAVFEPDGKRALTLEVPSFVDFALDSNGHVYLLGRERVTKLELTR
jgi:sugar lactone lactonase YvrE